MENLLLKNRLRKAIDTKGISTAKLAKLCELKPSFIYDILNGKSTNPNTASMARISQALDTNLSDLLGISPDGIEIQRDSSEYVKVSTILTTVAPQEGSAEFALKEKQGEPYYFRQSWVQDRLATKPENLKMVFIEGDNMDPTLCQGDMILIDISKKTPSPPGIFVLFDGMGLVVKRLEFLSHLTPPTLKILSDNPQYPAYESTMEESSIIGRVVWFSREL